MPFIGDGNCTEQLVLRPLTQAWSLAIELTFYAALLLYVIAAERLACGRHVLSCPGSSWRCSRSSPPRA